MHTIDLHTYHTVATDVRYLFIQNLALLPSTAAAAAAARMPKFRLPLPAYL